jgi:hypothetical protein
MPIPFHYICPLLLDPFTLSPARLARYSYLYSNQLPLSISLWCSSTIWLLLLVFSAQLSEVWAHPLSLYLPSSLKLRSSLPPLPSKTTENYLPVLYRIGPLPVSLVLYFVYYSLQYCFPNVYQEWPCFFYLV